MNEIKCPHCSTAFKVDEAGYANILKQVRDSEFEQQLHDRLELAEKEKMREVELAKSNTRNDMQAAASAKDAEIQNLKAIIDKGDIARKLAVTDALKDVEKERNFLANKLEKEREHNKSALNLAEEKLTSRDAQEQLAIAEAVSKVEKERDELKNGEQHPLTGDSCLEFMREREN